MAFLEIIFLVQGKPVTQPAHFFQCHLAEFIRGVRPVKSITVKSFHQNPDPSHWRILMKVRRQLQNAPGQAFSFKVLISTWNNSGGQDGAASIRMYPEIRRRTAAVPVGHYRNRYLLFCTPVPTGLSAGSELPNPFGPEPGLFPNFLLASTMAYIILIAHSDTN